VAIAAIILSVLALAVAGWAAWSSHRSARSAERSAEEGRRSRLDRLGPQVFIDELERVRERWMVGPMGLRHPPGLAKPGTAFESPGNDDVRLLIGARLLITNEGTRGAHLSIGGYRVDDADDRPGLGEEWLTSVLEPPPPPARDTLIPDGRLTIEPNHRVAVFVRTGPTVREWIDNGDQPCTVDITAWTSPEGAHQVWELTLETQLLTTVPFNASRYDLLPHVMPETRLEERARHYPTPQD